MEYCLILAAPYIDTSIDGTDSSLWQIQGGKPKLIGYASKTLPEACSRYSVTELEMTGLLVNMNLWKNLLKHREFDATVELKQNLQQQE